MRARKYLRRKGVEAFLQKYLQDSPNSYDLLHLGHLLGELSPGEITVNFNNLENLQQSLNSLHDIMEKVLRSRDRIKRINSPTDVIYEIEKAKNIIVITGAGISTSLGIPDFRSNGGLYNFDLKEFGFKNADEMFNYEIFKDDPSKFFKAAHLILPDEKRFTLTHAFIKELEVKGKLLRNYSQNIDGLEDNAGISPEKIIRCHGSFNTASCQTPKCKFKTHGRKIFPVIKKNEIPICPRCNKKRRRKVEKYGIETYGVVKPNITFFGEDLPQRYFEHVDKDIDMCDLLIVIGTSLMVSPVNEIATNLPHHVPQVLINKDALNHCEFDVSLLGYSDIISMYLAKKLQWHLSHEDFEKLKRENKYISIEDDNTDAVHQVQIKDEKSDRNQLKETVLEFD